METLILYFAGLTVAEAQAIVNLVRPISAQLSFSQVSLVPAALVPPGDTVDPPGPRDPIA